MKPNANFSQLLKPDSKQSQPSSRTEDIKSLVERDAILQDFICILYKTYLLSLTSLHKDLHQFNFHNKIKINDIVLTPSAPDFFGGVPCDPDSPVLWNRLPF